MPRSINFRIVPSRRLQATYTTSTRRIAQAMHVARHASVDNTMAIICIVMALKIDIAMMAGDRNMMDATDATTSQNTEAAVAEVTMQ